VPWLAQIPDAPIDELNEAASTLEKTWETAVAGLPRLGVAVLVFLALWALGRLVRPLMRRHLLKRRTESFANVFSRLIGTGFSVVGFFLAVTVVFPSVKPVDVLAGLGILSVALGFAFKDILENLLAGVLLLFRQPFQSGDQIESDEWVGTVERINIRETVIKRYDGRQVLIPNAKVYTNAVLVQTGYDLVRSNLVVGVAYETDLPEAARLAVEAMRSVEGVADDPTPEALYIGWGASSIELDLRYWTVPRQIDIRRIQSDVVEAVSEAFNRGGVEIPFDILTLRPAAEMADAMGAASTNGDAG
jgi:small conductance mechanosensitive channel